MDLNNVYRNFNLANSNLKSFYSKSVGKIGEEVIEAYLINEGYDLVGKNIRIGNFGEIDLVFMAKNGTFMFIEVKSSFINRPPNDNIGRVRDLKRGKIVTVKSYDDEPDGQMYGSKSRFHMKSGNKDCRQSDLDSIEPLFSASDRLTVRKRAKILSLVERYCLRHNIDFNDNVEIYLAHLTLFSAELSMKEFGISNSKSMANIIDKLYYVPKFFRIEV